MKKSVSRPAPAPLVEGEVEEIKSPARVTGAEDAFHQEGEKVLEEGEAEAVPSKGDREDLWWSRSFTTRNFGCFFGGCTLFGSS